MHTIKNNIKINNINLYYEEAGFGEVIIFLHGNGEDLHIFDKSIDFFSKEYKVIAVDSRGHGQSGFGTKNLTIPLLSKDIIEFITCNKLNNVSIVGFSDGGNIALEVAAALAPTGTIKNIILVGANLYFNGLKFLVRADVLVREFFFSMFSFVPSINKKKKISRLMSRQPEITHNKLKKITSKALIIVGEFDMIKFSHTQEINNIIKNSKLEIIKNGNHFLFRDNTQEINNIIKKFLQN